MAGHLFFGDNCERNFRTWTFWTYLKRAAKAIGKDGFEILKQASSFNQFANERVDEALTKVFLKPERKKATSAIEVA